MKDSAFIRGKVPMTKEEIRSIVLSKLELQPGDILMDIGAGTGSVSIESAFSVPDGRVIAIEHKPEALELIQQNIEKHRLTNIEVVAAKAPEGMESIAEVDKFFIGGSGGNLKVILDRINSDAKSNAIIVLTAIAMDTLIGAYSYFKENAYAFELIQVSVNKADTTARLPMLLAQNPIFILTAKKQNP